MQSPSSDRSVAAAMAGLVRRAHRGGAVAVLAVLCACGSTNKGESSPPTYTVRGSVTGLAGTGLVLRNAGGDDLAVAADGAFAFATPLGAGARYAVTVETQPSGPAQTCTVTNGAGTVGGADVTGIAVTCATRSFAVRGMVTGLRGTGLALRNNGGDELAVLANGSFAFAVPVLSGQGFAVTVAAQPSGPAQTCAVTGGAGTVTGEDVAGVLVSCETRTFTVSGTLTGLNGSGLVLSLNGGANLPIAADGAFMFPASVASGDGYWVAVQAQPHDRTQLCTVTGGVGSVADGNVTGVEVACATRSFLVAGTVTGLAANGLVLRNNGGNDLAVAGNGYFAFTTPVLSGDAYAVTVQGQPSVPTQLCEVTHGAGTVGGADVAGVQVTCTTQSFHVTGTVTGLDGSGLVLRNNGGDNLSVTANGTFSFATPILSNLQYSVTVLTSPTNRTQVCTVTNGAGTIGGGDVTNIAVSCVTQSYRVRGTVSNLTGTGLVLQDNGGDNLLIATNGNFVFATSVRSGDAYAVTVLTQPSSPTQVCAVSQGTGTVAVADVADVSVVCANQAYRVGGTVTGLEGTGLTLRDNGGDDLPITGNGVFTFATSVPSAAGYVVTVLSQPSGPAQVCTVNRASGIVGGGDVTDVAVICSAQSIRVGGTVTGLRGTGLVLQDNSGDDLSIDADGAFTFVTPVAQGAGYLVTVRGQPRNPVQLCAVANGTGVAGSADVSNVAISCHGWGNAQLLEASNNAASMPRIATDGSGNAIAVWVQPDATAASIYSNRYAAGSGWGTAQVIETSSAVEAVPRIAMNAAGYAIAVWCQRAASGYDIWANRYAPGTGWGTAELVETNSTYTSTYPIIAMDAAGNGLVVWQQNDGARYNMWSNRYVAGTGWGTAELIETNDGAASSPQVAMDAAGNGLAVWYQYDGTRNNIWANRYTVGSGWGTAQLIETDDGNATAPQIAMSAAGDGVAIWLQSDGTRNNVWANRYTAGSGWGTAQLIETDNAGTATVPQIAVDALGNASAVWIQSDGTRNNVWANRYAAGSGWGVAQLIETDNAGDASTPQIAADGSGNATAIWAQSDGTRPNIWSNSYVAGAGWQAAQLVETSDGAASAPQVAISSSGLPMAVWVQNDGTANSIFTSRFE